MYFIEIGNDRFPGMTMVKSILLGCVLLVVAFAAGCATTQDGDMPWNVPQPWEGTMGLPGFTPSDR